MADTYDVVITVKRNDDERITVSDDKYINQQEPDIDDRYYYREIMDLGIFRYDRAKKKMDVHYIDSTYYPFDSYEVVVDTILQFIYLIMLEFSVVPLHTAVLASGDKGIMLFGNSGAGKSTLESALLCSGLKYFADDVAFMSENGRVFCSSERILGCTPKTKRLIKDLFDTEFELRNAYSSVNKEIFAIDEELIAKYDSLFPRIIVFPKKNSGSSGLVEVSPKDTLIRLIKMSVSEFFSSKQKQLYFSRLWLLSQKAKAYEYRWNEDSNNLIEVCNRIISECEKEL
ncbi:MAG: hypothetical protein IK018_08515 [Lachnospiraceae bacterium]|nr:hypothetical protein [Lachnospiraceae bacterium]